ncbi:SigB/SigF/SigG family RNA polymerase sigma factor [Marinactinospora thermotolerans]|uniref:RNA polymerase sigma-B factor n=1 Tax=Marinactinospora thermotolerans DSM 45154 TaxID=1122192 RepID=A0A1T4LXS7_9ACTN|nr:SigB/SigF/SigG family RNA polymerase sigma factor [Marinactinospora thermotolerans]SJZ59530.1 RNA polymerase sigma-B factor [Marinactinospora thermotolerans DSM 45154]
MSSSTPPALAPSPSSPEPTREDHLPPAAAQQEASAEDLLATLAELPPGDPAREVIRARIVEMHAHIVRREAGRYRQRGEPMEDLVQVAMVGLLKAIRGFDPNYGKRFVSYLLPMVTGELKRHFRDSTWAIRVPRRHQERRSELNRVVAELTQRAGRTPSLTEIAAALDLDVADTMELIDAAAAYSALSLDAPFGEAGADTTLGDTIGDTDTDLEGVVDRHALYAAITHLPPRDRRVLLLRFFGNKTQSEIAGVMGISQMQVSRVLSATLQRLRSTMLDSS